jgi:membrane protein YdbS with pleckstrin-like domain
MTGSKFNKRHLINDDKKYRLSTLQRPPFGDGQRCACEKEETKSSNISAGWRRSFREPSMSYVKEVLQPGERVLYASTIHWLIYAPAILLLIVAILATFQTVGGSEFVWRSISLVCFAAASLSAARAWFKRWTTEIAVTDRRIIYKRGFIRRHTIEMNMDKVESVDVNQSLLGRVFGYGDVLVRGTGVGFEPLQMIESPIELRNAVTAR